MSTFCIVCYSTYLSKPMKCGSYICHNCITDWAKNRLIVDNLSEEVVIPCPNYQCEHNLTSEDLLSHLGPEKFEEINMRYTQAYLSNTEDIRRCPNSDCSYAGTIELKSCKDKLQCPECGYEWNELVQMPKYQKAIRSLKDTLSWKSETFSYLNEVLNGCPCPKCGLVIYKDGGCNHMVCLKCKYEFCWFCLGHYPAYVHSEWTFCPIRLLFRYLTLLIGFICVDYKLCSVLYYLHFAHSVLYQIFAAVLFYFLIPDIMLLSSLIIFPIFYSAFPSNVLYETSCMRNGRYICLGLLVLVPLLYVYIWYKIFYSTACYFIVTGLYYQVLLILLLAAACVTCWVSTKIITKLFKVFKRCVRKFEYNFPSIAAKYRKFKICQKKERAKTIENALEMLSNALEDD